MRKFYVPMVFFVFLMLAMSCASIKLISTWKDKDYAGGHIQRVLVVGATERLNDRVMFEAAFVKQLEAAGLKAISSFSVTSPNKSLDKDFIQTAAKKAAAPAVLVTHIVGTEKKDVYIPPMSHPAPYGRYYHLDHYYRSVVGYVQTPGYYTRQEFVVLETNLFETKAEKTIWSATSESFEPKSVAATTDALAKAVVRSLRDSGLIK